jgi:RNA polymerase sigma-70 factor (ECF subfamily)
MVCKQELFWQKGGEESPSERLAADLPPQAQKLKRRVKSRVDQMPSRMREAYLLCKVQRLRQKEAAQRMQISVKGVQRHLDLARNFLRQSLAAGQKNS